jgi:3-dehydroquinate synthase
MMQTVNVPLGMRAYDVVIGSGILNDAAQYITPLLPRMKISVVTEENVKTHQLQILLSSFSSDKFTVDVLTLPAGEATKSWDNLQQTVSWLLTVGVERNDVVIALGGGVIGDLVGFAAAILRRGVRFVQVPTSLLAQVDSSVGGKTGINSSHGKNLVGAFHQPSLVLADIGALETLPERDLLSGYGEVAKYGLLGDADFFNWLEENGPLIKSGDADARSYAVKRSVEMKADIVARDETEQGDRALLNLGHTFGHALEAATGYSDRLLHGEGVAIGCALAFDLSARLGLCAQEVPSRVRAHLSDMGIKCDLKDIPGDLPSNEKLIELMYQDKKVVAGNIRFILAEGIGEAFISSDVDLEIVARSLAASR